MKCPKCSASAPEGAAECPGCGIIFAKLAKVREREELEAKAAAALLEAAPPAAPVSNKARYIAIAFVAVWLVALAAGLHRSMRKSRPGRTSIPQTVRFADPRTGEERELPVVESAPRQDAPSAPARASRPPSSWDAGWVEEDGRKKRR